MKDFIKNIYTKSLFLQKIYNRSCFTKILHKITQFCIYCNEKRRTFFQFVRRIPRHFGYIDKRFIPLKEQKGKFSGKRCFVLCTGPSLTISDLELLKNEFTFGMNSICLIHDRTDWRPDFFSVQDRDVLRKIQNSLLTTDNGQVFFPYDIRKLINTPKDWILFPTSYSYHIYEMRYPKRYFARFSDNCYVTLFDGYSIVFTILQLASYMGFEEIYLLGADCSYLGEKQHFIEHGHYDVSFAEATDRLFAAYKEAKKYSDAHNIKIFNATRGGMLEIFPRVKLEEVLNKNEKNKVSKQ